MRRIIVSLIVLSALVLLCGCAAPKAEMQIVQETVVVEVEVPVTVVVTAEPLPTYTPYPTYTPVPKPTAPPTATPDPEPQAGTRKSPAQVGETIQYTTSQGVFDISITEVITGDEAKRRIADANMFNDTVTEGNEFVLFYTTVALVEVNDEGTIGFSEYDWTLVDASGKLWSAPSIVDPDPKFTGNGFEGATLEGWSSHIRTIGEQVSLVFDMDYDGTGGVWFSIP